MYKRQGVGSRVTDEQRNYRCNQRDAGAVEEDWKMEVVKGCLLYTSDAADDLLCVDLGGRRIIKKKKNNTEL
mgnify:CR=1 FL=1